MACANEIEGSRVCFVKDGEKPKIIISHIIRKEEEDIAEVG